MRIIQSTYSPLIDKIQIKDDQNNEMVTFMSSLCDKKVTLPPYVKSKHEYQSYRFEK